jgi:hypothetical protein
MRLFAARRDRDVRGMVLAESMHYIQFDAIGPIMPEQVPNESIELTKMRESWKRGWRKPGSNPELIDLPSSLDLDKTVTVPRTLFPRNQRIVIPEQSLSERQTRAFADARNFGQTADESPQPVEQFPTKLPR